MDDKGIRLLIRGTCYEEIEKSEVLLLDSEELKSLVDQRKKEIVEEFLKKMDKTGIINTAIGISKHRNEIPSLWTPSFLGKSYYGGVAGVIEDRLTISLKKDPDDENEMAETDDSISFSVRLQIRTRFDQENNYFLATLLLRDKIKLNDNMVLSDEEDLYDYMLLFWYKNKLLEAYEKGYYKAYRRFLANDDKLKGNIDFSRHIKLNVGQMNGKIAYSYRENTVNNFLNHMIVYAYEYLKKKYPDLVELNIDNDRELKDIIEGLKCEIGFEPVDSKSLIKENNRVISHPYYLEYEDLREICIKILRDEGISIWDAENEQTKSILFYVPDLWELYLEDKIREYGEIGADLFSQGKTPENDVEIKVFGKWDSDKKRYIYKQSTYPDFVFFDLKANKQPYLILDAKFKKGWKDALEKGAISDLNDYDKCIRDMNSLNAHATGVVFPLNKSSESGDEDIFTDDHIVHSISKYNTQDVFYTFPVVIPAENINGDIKVYSDWRREFESSVSNTINVINKKAICEKEYGREVKKIFEAFPKRKG